MIIKAYRPIDDALTSGPLSVMMARARRAWSFFSSISSARSNAARAYMMGMDIHTDIESTITRDTENTIASYTHTTHSYLRDVAHVVLA